MCHKIKHKSTRSFVCVVLNASVGGKPLMLSVYHVLIRLSYITSWKVNSIWETETVYFQDVQM